MRRPKGSPTGCGENGVLPPVHRALVSIVAALLLPGCAVNGLAFVEDTRVDIVRPEDRSEVALPVTIDWTVEDFDVGRGRGAFGVLIDRAPPRPGRTLAWLFRGDVACKGANAQLCSSRRFLEERAIYTTTETSLRVPQVRRLAGNDAGRVLHEATVILLDRQGRRIGESAWTVQFEVEGEDQ